MCKGWGERGKDRVGGRTHASRGGVRKGDDKGTRKQQVCSDSEHLRDRRVARRNITKRNLVITLAAGVATARVEVLFSSLVAPENPVERGKGAFTPPMYSVVGETKRQQKKTQKLRVAPQGLGGV